MIRTALAAVIPLFVIAIIASTASSLWQTRDGRDDRFEHLAEHGFFAAHPDFRPSSLPDDHAFPNFRSLELRLEAIPRSATPLVQTHTVRLHLDLRGRLEEDPLLDLPPSGVGTALASPPATRTQLQAFERLSSFAVASAAVELREPLSVGDFQRLLARHDLLDDDGDGVGIFLEGPEPRVDPRDAYHRRRLGWPNPFVAQFQAWTKRIRDGDDGVLERLGLPRTRELRELAADPRVHGFVLDAVTPRQLSGLRAEANVRAISLGDVAFDFGRGP